MVNSNRLETHRSSSGGQKRWLTLASSHQGTGQICPLGMERPSNIAQPFDLSTPTRPFPAVMDGFLCTLQVVIYRELQIFTYFSSTAYSPSFPFWLKLHFAALSTHMVIFSYQLASCQIMESTLLHEAELQMDMIIMTEALPLSDVAVPG